MSSITLDEPVPLVDLLFAVGGRCRLTVEIKDRDDRWHAAEEFLWEIVDRIENLSGISRDDIAEIAHRLAEGIDRNGSTPGGFEEGYCGKRRDLRPALRKLHKLDGDGTGARLWRELLTDHRSLMERVFPEGKQPTAADGPAGAAQSKTGPDTRKPSRSTVRGDGRSDTTEPASPAAPTDQFSALFRVFTDGVSDDRIKQAAQLLANDRLTANGKLMKIDALIRFPATASAAKLGQLLGVKKQAILKTEWWNQNRKGEKENEIGRRRAGHQKRAKEHEPPGERDGYR